MHIRVRQLALLPVLYAAGAAAEVKSPGGLFGCSIAQLQTAAGSKCLDQNTTSGHPNKSYYLQCSSAGVSCCSVTTVSSGVTVTSCPPPGPAIIRQTGSLPSGMNIPNNRVQACLGKLGTQYKAVAINARICPGPASTSAH